MIDSAALSNSAMMSRLNARATTLNSIVGMAASGSGGTAVNEVINGARAINDHLAVATGARFTEESAGLAAAIGRHGVPEEAVIPDLGCVVEQTGLGRIAGGRPDDSFQGFFSERRVLDEVVGVGDVCRVVLAIVEFERAFGNVRVERIHGVRQIGLGEHAFLVM